MTDWHSLCPLDHLSPDAIEPFTVNGVEVIAVLDSKGTPKVYRDLCSHQDVKLSDFGEITPERELICHAHAAKFCLAQGTALCHPGKDPLTAFPCKVEDDQLWVCI